MTNDAKSQNDVNKLMQEGLPDLYQHEADGNKHGNQIMGGLRAQFESMFGDATGLEILANPSPVKGKQ